MKQFIASVLSVVTLLFSYIGIKLPAIDIPGITTREVVGGYTQYRCVTDADRAVLNEALEKLDGVGFRPLLVQTQVVAGTNYHFVALATPVVPNPKPYLVYINVFKPLTGPAKQGAIEKMFG